MEFNINDEMKIALKELEEANEKYQQAKGKVQYLQSIILKMNAEANSVNELHNGVITQEDFDSASSS